MKPQNNLRTNMTESSSTADREIVITRVIQAPRDLVWEVWTNPDHVAKWWGPNGFTNTILSMDVRPGGVWRFIMHGPDGVDYPNKIVFIEVVKPERLVYSHGDDTDNGEADFQTTFTFEEHAGQTTVTLRALFVSAEARDKAVREVGAIEGGNQTLGRLAEYVAAMQTKECR